MGQRAKHHHFVPKVLQRQFAHEGEQIWYATRTDGVWGAPELRNISSTFRKRDLYTIMMDGVYSDAIEREYYGGIDNYLGEIIPELLTAFREGKTPLFRGDALNEVRKCALAMIRRTPDFSPAIYGGDEARGRDFVEKAIALHTEQGAPPETIIALQAELRDSARLTARGRDMRVRANVRPLVQSEKIFREFDVRWAVCEGKASLILPSVISFRLGNGESTSLSNPRVELWMPITPKIAMGLVRNPFGILPAMTLISKTKVRQINEHAMQSSTSVASHSQALLESLTGRRVRTGGRKKAGSDG